MTSAGELTRDFAVMGLHDDREDIPEGELTKTKSCGDLTLAFSGAELHGELEDTKELTKAKSCGDLTLAFSGMELHGELEDVKEYLTTLIAIKVPGGVMLAFDRRSTVTYDRTGVKEYVLTPKGNKWAALHPSLHVLNSGHVPLVGECRRLLKDYVDEKVLEDQVPPTVLEIKKELVKHLLSQDFDVYKFQRATFVIAGVLDGIPSIGLVRKDVVWRHGVSHSRVRHKIKRQYACYGTGCFAARKFLKNFKGVNDDCYVECLKRAMLSACEEDEGSGEKIHILLLKNDGQYVDKFEASVGVVGFGVPGKSIYG